MSVIYWCMNVVPLDLEQPFGRDLSFALQLTVTPLFCDTASSPPAKVQEAPATTVGSWERASTLSIDAIPRSSILPLIQAWMVPLFRAFMSVMVKDMKLVATLLLLQEVICNATNAMESQFLLRDTLNNNNINIMILVRLATASYLEMRLGLDSM